MYSQRWQKLHIWHKGPFYPPQQHPALLQSRITESLRLERTTKIIYFLFPIKMRKSWHVAHKFCTFSGSYLMRSTRTLVTVKRELHGPDSCWNSFLSQQGKSTSAITRWFISSGHWHLCDESPIQTSLHPPIICRPLNQHNQLKPTMSLLPSYSWVTWIHPKNPHWTSKGSLNWFFFFF